MYNVRFHVRWVPSEANCSDEPGRAHYQLLDKADSLHLTNNIFGRLAQGQRPPSEASLARLAQDGFTEAEPVGPGVESASCEGRSARAGDSTCCSVAAKDLGGSTGFTSATNASSDTDLGQPAAPKDTVSTGRCCTLGPCELRGL